MTAMKEFKVLNSFPVKKKASSPRSPQQQFRQRAQQLKVTSAKKAQSPSAVRRRKNQTCDFDNLEKGQNRRVEHRFFEQLATTKTFHFKKCDSKNIYTTSLEHADRPVSSAIFYKPAAASRSPRALNKEQACLMTGGWAKDSQRSGSKRNIKNLGISLNTLQNQMSQIGESLQKSSSSINMHPRKRSLSGRITLDFRSP